MALAIIGLAGVVLVVVLVLTLRKRSTQSLEDRLNELAALGEPISLEDIELSQPFAERVLIPLMQSATNFAQKITPQHQLEEARRQIALAGMTNKMQPAQLYVARMGLTVVIFALLFFTFFISGGGSDTPLMQRLLILAAGTGFGYYAPVGLLSSKIRQRQEEVEKGLPDALDLLTICVEAGLGFDAAMSKVAEKWDNELGRVFARAVQEMQLGKLRREALRSMAEGIEVADLTSFTAAIIQADQLGVSMARVMRIQSEQMRLKRRQRAEEKAREAPVKIMFPLVFFIFPTILIVLLGPAVLQFMASGMFS